MRIVRRKRTLHQKNCCVLPVTVQKSPSSSGTVTATWYSRVAALARFLEASLTTRQPGMHKFENPSISGTHFFKLFKRALFQRLTQKCREMALFLKNPMMDSFGCQEGGGFRRWEGKLVSPVRRDYPLHPLTDRREKEGEETGRKKERNPP